MKCRTEVPAETMLQINNTALLLGYTAKRFDAKISRWKLVDKLLAYAQTHPDLFRL